MNNVKFYFSRDFKLADMEVFLGTNNTVIATGNIVSKLRRVPRITICSIFDPDKKTLTFGVSRCSAKDTFVKATGRDLAYKRAITEPYKVVSVPDNEKISKVFINTCLEIENEIMAMVYPISFKKQYYKFIVTEYVAYCDGSFQSSIESGG